MTKKVLLLGGLVLCMAFSFAQTKIAFCDVEKVLPFMPEMKDALILQKEYEVYFSKKLEEKELAHEKAFNEYLEFARLRKIEENDEKKVAMENEVVALNNEVKYQQEEIQYALKKILSDGRKQAINHILLTLKKIAAEENIDYVLNKPSLYWEKIEIDLTEKVLHQIIFPETPSLIRGAKKESN